MKPIRAIVTDLDGTLLDSFKDVSRTNRIALSEMKKNGMLIGIASGRSTYQIYHLLKIWEMFELVDFVIGSNGCEYMNMHTGNILEIGFLSHKDLLRIAKFLKPHKLSVSVWMPNGIYWYKPTILSTFISIAVTRKPMYNRIKDLSFAYFPKVNVFGSRRQIKKLLERAAETEYKLIPVGSHGVEIVAGDMSKYKGLQSAMADFGFRAEETLFFGDDYNDIELLRRTQGVAMKNAIPIVQTAARAVTKYSNSQSGLAYHLNGLVMGDEYDFQIDHNEAIQ